MYHNLHRKQYLFMKNFRTPLRFYSWCSTRGAHGNLAYKAAIPKSTLLNIIHGTNPTIETIQKICGGFDISLGTFFNTDYFYEIYDDE